MGQLNYNHRKLDLMARSWHDIAPADTATTEQTFRSTVIFFFKEKR